MKKIITISFLVIYLLSLAGNSLYLDYLISRNQQETTLNIDAGRYDASLLIEVKIPLRLPYYSSSVKYERYYGEVNIEGQNYSYVQRKVLNDTVYLLCLPDHAKNKLQQAKASLAVGMENDFAPSKKGADPFVKKYPTQTEYDQSLYTIDINYNIPLNKAVADHTGEKFVSGYSVPPLKPPSVNSSYYNSEISTCRLSLAITPAS